LRRNRTRSPLSVGPVQETEHFPAKERWLGRTGRVSVNALSAELKAAGITISSGALAKYLSRRSSASAKKPAKHVADPHGQVKTGAKEPEHRESETGPK